jgi:hypothetical protein
MERVLSCDEELGAGIAEDAGSRLGELAVYIRLKMIQEATARGDAMKIFVRSRSLELQPCDMRQQIYKRVGYVSSSGRDTFRHCAGTSISPHDHGCELTLGPRDICMPNGRG